MSSSVLLTLHFSVLVGYSKCNMAVDCSQLQITAHACRSRSIGCRIVVSETNLFKACDHEQKNKHFIFLQVLALFVSNLLRRPPRQ